MIRHHLRKYDQYTDAQCVANFRVTGDPEILAILFDRYLDLVYGVCLKYLKDPALSEDATMELFEVLLDKLRTHDVEAFRGWLYAVTRNHCLQILRRRKPLLTEDLDALAVYSEDPEHHEEEAVTDQLRHLDECLDQLPPDQKICVEMFYRESRSYNEIAQFLAIGKESVRSHLQNGRRNLRRCMDGTQSGSRR